jgi:dihydropteroate synthase
MTEHILFLTGKLAEKRLHKVLESMQASEFTYEIRNIGVSVAALMTAGMIARRLDSLEGIDRIIVPGQCRGDVTELTAQLGVPVIKGTDDVKDLPTFFGRDCQPVDLNRHNVLIFAEIVDAVEISIEEIIMRAQLYADDGADVIDIGCLPDTDFPHLDEAVSLLKSEGFMVSVDSLDNDELLRGARAGADYLLSLKESTLWIADEVEATPVLIPEHHPQIDSLYRAMDKLSEQGKPFIADSILDPIHFGFTGSIMRYAELRQRYPNCEIMMGVGNLTELTEADTSGINAILFGIISELEVSSVLTTQVSPHACSTIREADKARRMYYAAKQQNSLPKGIDSALLTTHARKPFPYTANEIAELAAEIKDPSYRIQVSALGLHVFNRDGISTANDPFTLFPELASLQDDAAHAFYMGVELAKAQIAWRLGKRYVQDEELDWGAAVAKSADNEIALLQAAHNLKKNDQHKNAGTTMQASRKKRRKLR